jgi:hypothetical protein
MASYLTKFKQNAVPASWIFPSDIKMLIAHNATSATFQATITDDSDMTISFRCPASCRAANSTSLTFAMIATFIFINDTDVRATRIHFVAILK